MEIRIPIRAFGYKNKIMSNIMLKLIKAKLAQPEYIKELQAIINKAHKEVAEGTEIDEVFVKRLSKL